MKDIVDILDEFRHGKFGGIGTYAIVLMQTERRIRAIISKELDELRVLEDDSEYTPKAVNGIISKCQHFIKLSREEG